MDREAVSSGWGYGRIISLLVATVFGVVVLSAGLGSFYKVDETERAVLLTNGRLTEVVGPGLRWKTPFFQSVVKVPLTVGAARWQGDTRMEAYSSDQQAADLVVSITYRVDPSKVDVLYREFRGDPAAAVSRTLTTQVPKALKEVFGQYAAETVIQKRGEFNAKAEARVREVVGTGSLILETFQVEDIAFSPAYEQAVEARMTAQVLVAQERQKMEQAKVINETAINKATADATSRKLQADAEAYAVEAAGMAEAEAIKARAAALANNPALVELTKAERWNGTLPTTMLPNATVPFLEVGK